MFQDFSYLCSLVLVHSRLGLSRLGLACLALGPLPPVYSLRDQGGDPGLPAPMPTLLWTADQPPFARTAAFATKINLFPTCRRLQLWVKFSPLDTGENCSGAFSHRSSESLVYNLRPWGWRDWKGDLRLG